MALNKLLIKNFRQLFFHRPNSSNINNNQSNINNSLHNNMGLNILFNNNFNNRPSMHNNNTLNINQIPNIFLNINLKIKLLICQFLLIR